MKVWLVKVGEPLPTDVMTGRLFRTGLLAEQLASRGHDVVWWSSTFNHANKTRRAERENEQRVSDRLNIVQLHGRQYDRNVSLARMKNHAEEAAGFARLTARRDAPAVIVAAYPTIELSYECARYALERNVPLVVDVRDLWPDIFLDLAPMPLRPAVRFALRRTFQRKRFAFRHAKSITGTSDAFVRWGLAAAGRAATPLDRSFAHGYQSKPLSPERKQRAEEFWRRHFRGDFPPNILCFFGNFGHPAVLDLDTVVAAMRSLREKGEEVHAVLCGEGPMRARIAASVAGFPNVTLPGLVGAAEIRVLMEHSLAGLIPYKSRWDFDATMPNKVGEYLSAGLPILTSMSGEVRNLLLSEHCGLLYNEQDSLDLAGQLTKLLHDRALLSSLTAAARKLFGERFAASAVYSEFAAHVERVAAVGAT